MNAAGDVERLGDEAFFAAFMGTPNKNTSFGHDTSPRIEPVRGTPLAWVFPIHRADHPALVDLSKGTVVREVDLPFGQRPLLAATSDTLYFLLESGRVAFHPDAPDPATTLKPVASARNLVNSTLHPVVTGDGALWMAAQGGIALYENHTVALLPHTAKLRPTILIPGKNVVLVQSDNNWHLVTRTELISGGLIEDFIQDHKQAILDGFSGTQHTWWPQPVYLRADPAGNIWLGQESTGEIKVLSGGTWVDAADRIVAAGNPDGKASLILPIGDGSKMYVSSLSNQDIDRIPRAFIATCEKGQLSFAPAPLIRPAMLNQPVAYSDSQGALWMNTLWGVSTKERRITPAGVVRFTASETSAPLNGRLMAVDPDDHPWLYEFITAERNTRPNRLYILNGATPILAPNFSMYVGGPVILGPGRSVYVATEDGLYSARASGPRDNPQYVVGPALRLGPPMPEPLIITCGTDSLCVPGQRSLPPSTYQFFVPPQP
jgi:hypothetical protein